MNWLASIGVGICAAPLTGLICGTAAALCAEWMRVPKREGAAGFFAFGIALLGVFLGLVVGIAFGRGWLQTVPSFGKALGLTLATFAALSLAITALVWLTADLKPKINGRPLELAIELRCPPGTTLGAANESSMAYVTFVRLSDGNSRGYATLDLKAAREVERRYVIPATLTIETSAARKLLNVRLGESHNLMFALDFGSKPKEKDFQWSRWIQAGHRLGELPPPADQAFAVRYQVRLIEPPPPPPTREQIEAAEDAKQEAAMRALAPDAPLAQWLIFTRYGVPQPRIDAAVAAIRARPRFAEEMAHEMLDGEYDSSRDALRAIEHVEPPPTELAEAVAAVGREIAQTVRDLDVTTPPPEQQYSHGADISTRFSAWMVATRALQGKDGVDFVPQLQEIIEPARKHDQSYVLRTDVVRVASFYLQKWGGIEPLPTDPPPR